MEHFYREFDRQASSYFPQSSRYNSIAEQALLAGYEGPASGRTPHEFFTMQYTQLHLNPFPHRQSYLHANPSPCAPDIREAILRELEKDKIREEIIAYEIARIRVLEAEVRRELMMERELASRRGSYAFPFSLLPVIGRDSPMTRAEGTIPDERSTMSLQKWGRLNSRSESGGYNTLPFHRGTADLRISEVKPVLEEKEKEKISLRGKHNDHILGLKRKAVSPAGADASELPADGVLKKKAKEEWGCALCQINATNQRGLDEHLQGKKHKAREDALRSHPSGKSYSIGLFPRKASWSTQVVGSFDAQTQNVVKCTPRPSPIKKTGEASSIIDEVKSAPESPLLKKTAMAGPRKDEQPSAEELLSVNLKKTNSKVAAKIQKKDDPKYAKCKFWCPVCQVGLSNEESLNIHKMGKKHVRLQKKVDENGGAGSSKKEKVAMIVRRINGTAEDRKTISLGCLDEAEAVDRKSTNKLRPDYHFPDNLHREAVDRVKSVTPSALLLKKNGEDSLNKDDQPPLQPQNSHAIKRRILKNDRKLQKKDPKSTRFFCELCQVGTHSEMVMNDHTNGKKHIARREQLNRNGGAGPCNAKEKLQVVVHHAEGKAEAMETIPWKIVGLLHDQVPLETLNPDNQNPVDNLLPEEAIKRSEDQNPVETLKPDNNNPLPKVATIVRKA